MANNEFTTVAPCFPGRTSACFRSPVFKAVRVDPGGYGISWSDDIDISEYELWTNGESIANQAMQPTGSAGG